MVATSLAVVAWALLLLLAIPVGVFALQVTRHSAAPAVPPGVEPPARGAVVVLVPAHDEEAGLAHTLSTLLPQLGDGDHILVVADNCSDATARVAREAGARVLERFHATDRGKGFALAFGIEHLRAAPPWAVVVVDADCELAPGALDRLLGVLARTARPVQARYLMLGPPGAALPRRLAEFAWRVRNWSRPAGGFRLGMPCQLMGTGMAFSWDMLSDAPLANASIVEDMKLGVDLALRGQAPVFCEPALVTSRFPDKEKAVSTQRTRWEHGHLEMILREAGPLLGAALRRRDSRLLGMALDLAVPPLALLAGLLASGWILALAAGLLGAGAGGLGLASLLLALFAAAVLHAWHARGRDLVRLSELLCVPWYILRKIPMYLRFVTSRQKQWVRTDRNK